MINSFQLYRELESMDLLSHRPLRWWPNAGTFEVIIGSHSHTKYHLAQCGKIVKES